MSQELSKWTGEAEVAEKPPCRPSSDTLKPHGASLSTASYFLIHEVGILLGTLPGAWEDLRMEMCFVNQTAQYSQNIVIGF